MPAPKTLTERVIKRELLHQKNAWTPMEASQWSGIRYRTLLLMLKQGLVPAIPVGKKQSQKMPTGKRRKRACRKYVLPRVAFMRWYENLGAPDPRSIGKTAA
jgi:hypothetical protein